MLFLPALFEPSTFLSPRLAGQSARCSRARTMTAALLAAGLCSLGSVPAYAEKADSAKPMNIEADQLRHDELEQTSVFTGNVVVTKGTIVLRGSKLEVRQDNDGYQSGVVTGSADKRAFFRQKRDTAPGAPEEFIEGEGATIRYDGKADSVRFSTRAELRRYRGADLSDQITGDVIVYNNGTDVFTVDGKNTNKNPGDGGGSPGRVRAVLAPRDGALPAATPDNKAPLRPSKRLGSAEK